MTHPTPGHQPGPQPYAYAPQPVPPPAERPPGGPRWTPGLVAAVAFAAATAATVWGTFEKLQTFRHEFGEGADRTVGSSVTWWQLETLSSGDESYPPYGVLPSVAAGLLLIAAVLALSAFRNRRPGLVTAVRVSAALGAGLLTGVLAVRLMDVLQALSEFNDQEIGPGQSSSFQVGLGIWLPGGAAVVALAGVLLTLTRPRTALARIEPDTPRMGIPMPYGYGAAPYQQPGPQPPYQPAQQQAAQPVPPQAPQPPAPPTPPRPEPQTPPAGAQPEPPAAPREQAPAAPGGTEPRPAATQGDQPEN